MSSVAKDLKDAFNLLSVNPNKEGFFEKYYVKRESTRSDELFTIISISDSHTKILFSGHRGSGKTTELHHLESALEENNFLVVFVAAVDDKLKRTDLYYTDILLVILEQTVQMLLNKNIDIEDKVVKKLEDLLAHLAGDKQTETIITKTKGWRIGAFFKIIGGHLTGDKETRTILRKNANSLVQELIDIFNEIIETVEEKTNKKIVVIVDDLEKVTNHKTISEFLIGYNNTILALNCHLVLTIPSSLIHSPELKQVRNSYDHMYSLPLFEVKENTGNENGLQIESLKEIVRKRVPEEIISSEIIKNSALMSGGLITDFLRLLQNGCLKAVTQKKSFTNEILNQSFGELVEEYQTSIDGKYYDRLKEIHQSKITETDDDLRNLLFSLAVLEYKADNGVKWYDIHPALKSIV